MDSYHPLLSQEAKPEEEPKTEEQPAEPVAPVEASEPEATGTEAQVEIPAETEAAVVETPAAPVEDTNVLRIDRNNFYRELSRLRDSDPELGQVLRTWAGRTAKSNAQNSEVLEAENKQLKAQVEALTFAAEMSKMRAEQGDEAINKRLVEDPDFARKYHQQAEPVNVDAVRERVSIQSKIEEAYDHALSSGLSAQRVQEYQNAVQSGYFDYARDQAGNPIRQLSTAEAFEWFNRSIRDEATEARVRAQVATPPAQPTPEPPAPAPVVEPPKVNPALAERGPDLSGGQGRGGSVMTVDEYRQLNPVERMNQFPEGLEGAISAGKITRPRS